MATYSCTECRGPRDVPDESICNGCHEATTQRVLQDLAPMLRRLSDDDSFPLSELLQG